MRIHSLYVREFKNLREIKVSFDRGPFAVVVGRNGTGKSNLIEALVLIFRNLDLAEDPPFPYRIQFECRGSTVDIDATGPRASYRVGPSPDALEEVSKAGFEGRDTVGRRLYLPAHVFGYYSGPSNRLEAHFEAHQVRFYRSLLAGEQVAHLRPLFYARTVQSQFVLLAFFSGLGEDRTPFLKKYLGIDGLQSVLFVLNQPGWGKAKKYRHYEWFWQARGVVRAFLDGLHAAALAPLQLTNVRVPIGLARTEDRDHYFFYLRDPAALRKLAAPYATAGGQHAFFSALESTYTSDLIREVRVVVRVGRNEQALSFRELSEGEQQLLMVLGLLKFTQEEESLFLLDEPDTHLNPAWSIEYLDLLGQVVGQSERSHFVITTHDPLVIAGRTKEEVRLLERDGDGNIRVSTPVDDPRGMGVAALLTSEIYGLRSELDLFTLEKIERKRELSLEDRITPAEIRELAEINEYLTPLGFADSARDPAQQSWARLLTAIQADLGIEGATLTAEQSAKLASRLDAIRVDLKSELQ